MTEPDELLIDIRRRIEALDTQADFRRIAGQLRRAMPYFYDDEKGLWYFWNHGNTRYENVSKEKVLSLVNNVFDRREVCQPRVKTLLMNGMTIVGIDHVPKALPKYYVQFKNKLFNINTGEITDASPDVFCVNPIHWKLGKSKDTPIIDKLLREWVGEDEAKILLQVLAFAMLRDYAIHRAFALVGSGRNGKDKFLKLVTKLVGNENITATSIERLTQHGRFESSRMLDKLVCLISETNKQVISDTAMMKGLTGDSQIPAEVKGGKNFQLLSYAKVIMATNSLPITADTTDGFYSRWRVIMFPYKFKEQACPIDKIPDIEMENLCFRLTDVLKDLLEEHSFHNDGDIESRRESYENVSNPLPEFIKEHCVVGETLSVKRSRFNAELAKFTKQRVGHSLSASVAFRAMTELGYEDGFKYVREDRSESRYQERIWKGLTLKSELLKDADSKQPDTSSKESDIRNW